MTPEGEIQMINQNEGMPDYIITTKPTGETNELLGLLQFGSVDDISALP